MQRKRPSPAMIVAVTALSFALVGTAVAGTDVAGKLTKSKVKSIARKQADKELKANIAGSHVNKADHATNANALGGVPPSSYATASSEAFHNIGASGEPPFENGYANFGGAFSTAGFYKDSLGIVHLKGTITGTAGAVAFTLPPNYRPATNLFMPVAGNGAPQTAGDMVINSDGTVVPNRTGGGVGNYGLDAVSFRVGQ